MEQNKREIKFRVWNLDRKEWAEYGVLDMNGSFKQEGVGYHEYNYVVQLFTGLLDKNGKEIYEGDIVEYLQMFGSSKTDEWNREKGIVRWWKDGWLPFVWENDMSGDDDWYSNHQKDYRIIGNIYENPNLLSEK